MHATRPACPLCASTDSTRFLALDHRAVVRCGACGLVYCSAYEEEALRRAYGESYYPAGGEAGMRKWNERHAPVWAGLVADLARRAPAIDSLLDLGAGTGGFLAVFRARFPKARLHAVESAPRARAWLEGNFPDLTFPCQEAGDLGQCAERYEAVTMLQCLEHVPDPRRLCADVYGRLKEGGILLVTVPNRFSYRAFLRGTADPFCYGNPTHLQFFSAGTLRRMLREAGFQMVARIARWGGGGAGALGTLPQYAARVLGVSSELRFIAAKP